MLVAAESNECAAWILSEGFDAALAVSNKLGVWQVQCLAQRQFEVPAVVELRLGVTRVRNDFFVFGG